LKVKASAPVRIDLAGGWSDVTYFTKKYTGSVVNIAINKRAYAELNIDDEGHLKMNYECDVPVGTGLGTSSAINVALLSCINHSNYSPEKSAEMAHKFEIILGGPVGRQDQWASAFGGAQYLRFNNEDVKIMPFKPMVSTIEWLEKHLVIAHSRIAHKSGEVHSPIWEKFNQGDSKIVNAISKLKDLADDMAKALESDQRESISDILNLVTITTDELSPSINNPVRIICDSLIDEDIISAWKVMGAGGGGAVALLSKSGKVNETKKACENAGWMIIEWSIDNQGVLIEK
tara:strand:+ start:4658 stop:5524 length:867 start_codon:yes stop_codon:yes gene_type:complete